MTKMLCLVACAIGVVCTVAPIIVERESVKREYESLTDSHIFVRMLMQMHIYIYIQL